MDATCLTMLSTCYLLFCCKNWSLIQPSHVEHGCFGVFFTRSSDVWCLLQVLCDVDSKESWRRGGNNNLLHPCSFDVDRGASLVLLFSFFFFFIMRSSISSSVSFSLSSRLLCRCTNQRDCWFSLKKKKELPSVFVMWLILVAEWLMLWWGSLIVWNCSHGCIVCTESSWAHMLLWDGGDIIVCKIGRGEGGCQSELCLFFVVTSNSYLHSVVLQSSVLQSAWTITLGGVFQCFDADVVEAGMAKWIPRNGSKIPEETTSNGNTSKGAKSLRDVNISSENGLSRKLSKCSLLMINS